MATIKYIIVTVLVLSAFLSICLGQRDQGGPHVSQGSPHQNQGRTPREVSLGQNSLADIEDQSNGMEQNPQNWTTCDMSLVTKISCHDCNTRLICKPIGGLLKSCSNPRRPHCNLGICSAMPNPTCV